MLLHVACAYAMMESIDCLLRTAPMRTPEQYTRTAIGSKSTHLHVVSSFEAPLHDHMTWLHPLITYTTAL